MFFEGDRIDAMREMILADNTRRPEGGARQAPAVSARGLHRHLQGAQGIARPPSVCSIRRSTNSSRTTADSAAGSRRKDRHQRREVIAQRVEQLHEFNPMLGHRGCRLGIAYPEITEMQARAIFEAAADVAKKKIKVKPKS